MPHPAVRSFIAALALIAGAAATLRAQNSTKGVWEPVSYQADISFNSVYFVTPDEGWVTGGAPGGHGVLLHTSDGGGHWDVAAGDPEGSQRAFTGLQFIDEHTGFAVQITDGGDYTLVRTTDGATWTSSGTVPQHYLDYRFISPTTGVASYNNEIRRTTDGGRTWSKVFDCTTTVPVQGLTRRVRCEAAAFAFPTATTGIAIGNSFEAKGLYVLRSGDGGATWSVTLAMPDVDGREGHVFFTDENTGYVCTADGRIFGTTDGGQTWNGLIGAACETKAPLLFADGMVGWALRYRKLTFTTDGGRHWASREIAFPAGVAAFSIPRSDRAYAVGDHGMIFRYRVVSVTATDVAPAALAAPAMPGLPMALGTDVQQLQGQVAAIDSGLAAFVPPAAAPMPSGTVANGMAPFVSDCCGKRVSSLQLIFAAVTNIVPEFTSKYRNLNLLTQGLRTAAALPDATTALRAALETFRTAGDKTSAQNALSQIKTALATLHAASDTALQQPTFVQQ
ncbi:MAG: WD40/YVTN/BNR-like repeat-containing protein [Gemmatimonadales bacterium]